jgi:hypothetical protein
MTNTYSNLVAYIKRNRLTSTFDANTLRTKLNTDPKTFSSVLSKAVRENLIHKVGVVPSDVPSHNGRQVGVYCRTARSYYSGVRD